MARQSAGRCGAIWVWAALALLAALVASLLLGARPIPISAIWQTLLGESNEYSPLILHGRLPRTLLALLAGLALGLSGILMQAITRNPLADPGILGINAGASFAVVALVGILGLSGQVAIITAALVGTFCAASLVFVLGNLRAVAAHPAHIVLAGVAINAVLTGLCSAITLLNPAAFDRLRFWNAGSVDIMTLTPVLYASPLLLAGGLLALVLAAPLNAVVLGRHTAAALGVRHQHILLMALLAMTLLIGTSTALTGPIGFIGLMIPHLTRWLIGQDQRRMMFLACLLAPLLLLAADILGRFMLTNGIRVAVVTALIGAPVMIYLIRRPTSESS